MSYTPIIGMEVHVELKTKSKMFCSCPNNPETREPNTNICEICLGHPGTLPVPNKQAIIWSTLIGRALGCNIREVSKFDRKHYFYPDLPKGYQISQYDEPIAEQGSITLQFFLDENARETAVIGIERAHLEEDTAKLLHDKDGSTYADFNRSSTPLVEIVTKPDFQSALEAKTFCQELRSILRCLGVSDADMEKGQMRCEANVSVQETGKFEIVGGKVIPASGYTLNNKVEVKNINSFKAVERAIEFEIQRQTAMLEKGETWLQQTRGWDEDKGETVMQRVKENAADYRYFPEPDIPPFSPVKLAEGTSLPELPQSKRTRFHSEYGFSYADAKILCEDKFLASFTENVMSETEAWLKDLTEKTETQIEEEKSKIAKLVSGWITTKLFGMLKEKEMLLENIKISPENFAEFIALVYTSKINSTNAQKLLLDMVESGVDMDPTHVMEEKGYGQVSDEGTLLLKIEEVIVSYPSQVEQFKSGKDPVIKFLIGMVMKATEGTADPVVVEKLLREKLV